MKHTAFRAHVLLLKAQFIGRGSVLAREVPLSSIAVF